MKALAFGALIMLGAACACVNAAVAQEVGVAARVNGVEISVLRLERFFQEYSRTQPGGFQLITNPAVYKRMKRQALEQLINRELFWQEAQRRSIRIDDDTLKRELERLRSMYKTPEEFNRKIRTMGFAEDSYAFYIRQELSIDRLMSEGLETEPVTDEDIEKFYSGNSEKFELPEAALARHILIRVPAGADVALREQARKKAADLLEKARGGSDFAALARDHSEDATAGNGGDLGWFPRARTVKAFEDAAFSMEPGQISDVVETEFGFHIIKLDAKKSAAKVPLNEVKERVRLYIEDTRRREAGQKLLDRLHAEAKIERVVPL